MRVDGSTGRQQPGVTLCYQQSRDRHRTMEALCNRSQAKPRHQTTLTIWRMSHPIYSPSLGSKCAVAARRMAECCKAGRKMCSCYGQKVSASLAGLPAPPIAASKICLHLPMRSAPGSINLACGQQGVSKRREFCGADVKPVT